VLRWGLICALLSLEACGGTTQKQGVLTANRPASCGEAQAEAIQLDSQSRLEEALERHGDALELCRDSPKAVDRELHSISGMARKAPELCPKAIDLFRRVPPSLRIDRLRSQAALRYFCPEGEPLPPDVSFLADVETRELYGSNGPMVRRLVVEYERAYLYYRARNPAEHLRSLRAATREICREGVVPLLMQGLERKSESEASPIGTLGFWTLQPREALDEEMKACLAHVASDVEADIGSSSAEVQRQLREWLVWYRSNVAKQ
jgi:hypothetical protein